MKHIKLFEEFKTESVSQDAISTNDKKLIDKIGELAKKYGYVRDEFDKEPESGIVDVIRWVDPKDKDYTFVEVYYSEKDGPGDLSVSWYYKGGRSGNDSLEEWADEATWINMTKEELDLYESYQSKIISLNI